MISPTGLRHAIERLGPYQSLAILVIPTGLIEPLKIVAVAWPAKDTGSQGRP
jgi:hypothetical protein